PVLTKLSIATKHPLLAPRTIALGVVFWCLLVAVSGCGTRAGPKRRHGDVERLPRLATIRPELHEKLEVRRTYTASIEPLERVELVAQVRGVVKMIAPEIDIGRAVKAGDVLLSLEIPDMLAERANKDALLEEKKNLVALSAQAIKVAGAEEKEA